MFNPYAPTIVNKGVSGMKTKRVAIYVRVSKPSQTVENQQLQLEEVAMRHGWEVVKVYKDEGISGAKGRSERPALNEMLKAVTRREVDLVAAWSVDRLGRSMTDLLATLGEVHASGCGLFLHQQGLDTSTPTGKAMFGMMGVFSEFERAMIQERVKSGLERAKERGTKSGRAIGRPKIGSEASKTKQKEALAKVARIKGLQAKGMGLQKVAKELGIGVGTVIRLVGGDEKRKPGAGLGRGKRAA
jgi:DNA invertase Pin-like site-specific DNA recombinase